MERKAKGPRFVGLGWFIVAADLTNGPVVESAEGKSLYQ